MISLTSTGTELRRFRRGLLPKLALGAMVLVPLLYGAMYLWAFWDPTGNLDRLPVAIVNADTGAERDDGELRAGDDITSTLVGSGDLQWAEVDADEAASGVRDGTYYFAVTVPEDFSARVVSAGGDDPQAAQIMVTYNDANSFLASTLGRGAMEQVQAAVREEIGAQAVDQVLVGLGSARDGFAEASDGALRLTAAGGELTDGAAQVADGADSAADGAGSLAEGIGTLTAGLGTAVDGASALSDGAGDLAEGTSTLAGGARELAGGTGDLVGGAGALASGANDATAGAARLADGAADAGSGARALAQGASATQAGVEQLADGSGRLVEGFEGDGGLVDGTDAAVAGAERLADGSRQVQAQVATLAGSVPQLRELLQGNVALLEALPAEAQTPQTQALRAANSDALDALPADGELAAGAAGVQELVDGADQLATSSSSGLPALAAGVREASDGVAALDAQLRPGAQTGSTTVRDGVDGLAAGAAELSGGLGDLGDGARDLARGSSALAAGAGALTDGAAQVDQGAQSLAGGAVRVDGGAGRLADGASSLTSGARELADGSGAAASGADELAAGTRELADGAGQVADGGGQLTDGAQDLSDGLADGAEAIPDDSDALRTQRADVLSAPVTVADTDVAAAEGFGEGFAPFFVPLALFVGALITWLLLRPLPSRALATPASGWRIALAGYLPALVVGAAQVVVMLAVIHYGVGMQMTHAAGTVAFTMLVAATFLALQQALVALLGAAAGKVAILALLMLQLASSGGTYPVETTPAFFQVVHPLLPMSYAVDGLRQTITGGVDGRLWVAVVYLVAVLLASLAISAWRAGRLRTWTLDRLHPALVI
ncbi:YhgE/Pip domain-containing protein [Oerskovia flava]|uniref:YhgE/Pip domain-containing protein n=1 Tax=Oerskovia flava TaxID=2986422 RepID=UPI00223EF4C8|nr:YhgE/Pip domain-containing protein [Oerskovia sp. JB1-3-2]